MIQPMKTGSAKSQSNWWRQAAIIHQKQDRWVSTHKSFIWNVRTAPFTIW